MNLKLRNLDLHLICSYNPHRKGEMRNDFAYASGGLILLTKFLSNTEGQQSETKVKTYLPIYS